MTILRGKMHMKKYCVTIVRTGCMFVEAENEAEAAQKVYDILAPVLGLKGGK